VAPAAAVPASLAPPQAAMVAAHTIGIDLRMDEHRTASDGEVLLELRYGTTRIVGPRKRRSVVLGV
jgi:hypothetical protein